MLVEKHSIYASNRKRIGLFSIINYLVPIISLFMFALLPTSKDENIFGAEYLICVWSVISVLVIYLASVNRVDRGIVILGSISVAYLLFVTSIELMTNQYARISLARIAPILCLLLLSSTVIKTKVPFFIMEKCFDIYCIIMIFWNLGIMFSNELVQSFTKSFYSQYYDNALYYSVMMNKPVMSFGVHSYAAYFYMLLFYLSYISAKNTGKIKYYVYCISIFIFTVFLSSNSSLVYGIVMMIMLFSLIKGKPVFIFAFMVIFFFILAFSLPDLLSKYLMIFNSRINGFIPRYFGDNTVFSENIRVIRNSMGIGFCIPDNLNLGYSDSGYMVYLTMGHIPFVVVIYSIIYKFIKNNFSKKHVWFLSFVIFSFEIALPATFNYRFPFVIIFVITFLKSIETYETLS